MAQKATKSTTEVEETAEGFSEFEKQALKERAQEVKKASRRRGRDKAAEDEKDLLAKLAEMSERDRAMGERLHELIKGAAPTLTSKLRYGMPTYYRDGKVVCFYQPADKFETRYASLGFDEGAQLDEGTMWPNAYALTELNPENEARIVELIKKAVGSGE